MSTQPIEPAPVAPVTDAPKPAEPAAAAPQASKPPWGDPENFDAEKAWALIENLRTEKKAPRLSDEDKAKLAEYDKLLDSQKTAEQKAQDARVAAEKRAEALVARAVKAEVKALAASGFADPEDAAAFLDLSKYAPADGDVDTEAIKSDLADLLSRKPHLGKSPANRLPAPNPAQGSSASGSAEPSQLSEADVQRMYAAKDYAGIEKARQEGRLTKVLGG